MVNDVLKKNDRETKIFIFLMLMPAMILLLLFVVVPLLIGLYTSLFMTNGFELTKFIGLDNYKFSFSDKVFLSSIWNTLYFAIAVTVAKNVAALLLANMLMKSGPGTTFFRTSIFIPVTFSFIVTGVLWSWIYNPVFGILNEALKFVGLESLIRPWLSDPSYALNSIIFVDIWKWTGFHLVIYMAGLIKIPQELYESADIDGANSWEKFVHITVPQLNMVIVLNVLLAFTGGFINNYDLIKVMTDGGPFNSTEVALSYIVKTLMKFVNIGKASAMTIILVIIVAVFGLIQLKVMTRKESND